MLAWKNLFPADLALKCFPFRVSSYLGEKSRLNVLHIHAEDTYTSIFLSYNAQILVQRIAILLGGKEINKINIKTISTS